MSDATSKSIAPGASDTFEHGADGDPKDYKPTYYGDDKVAKYSPSYAIYHRTPTEAAAGGSGENQKEVGGQSYPGRATPPVQQVTEAKSELNTTIRQQQKQTGLNRHPINEHEEKHKTHGPNN
jgi:hypothetical protein